jgi:hypothetical protein
MILTMYSTGSGIALHQGITPEQPSCARLRDVSDSATRSPGADVVGSDDLKKVLDYLRSENKYYLLDNIPHPDKMRFVDQDSVSNAQPQKLFIGKHDKNHQDIFAYMVLQGERHMVNFHVGNTMVIKAADVAEQNIVHPFDKTYPENSREIGKNEKAQLALMVKWYFIAAGIAKNCVLQESAQWPARFRRTLEYIDRRMELAKEDSIRYGAQPESDTRPATTSRSIPATLVEITPGSPPLSTPALACQRTTLTVTSNDSIDTIPRSGTKRPAGQDFDMLAVMVDQGRKEDLELCRQIDDVEGQLGPLRSHLEPVRDQVRRLEKKLLGLEMQYAELVQKRTEFTRAFTEQIAKKMKQ